MRERFKKLQVKGFTAVVLTTVILSASLVWANSGGVMREIFFGVDININGEILQVDDADRPFIMEGRTFLPVRALGDALGVSVDWYGPTQTVYVETEETSAAINPITEEEIRAAQVAWGEGLVAISAAYAEDEDYASIAQNVLDTLYGYADGVVLFKPTVASEVPFRFTEAEAASYFIGGSISEDTGFALNPWTSVRFANDGRFILNGETALWMGSVFLTNDQDEEIRVEKSKGYFRDAEGNLRLQLHHSSVPFEN
ncbi:MAG: stalk domain-containing protein [Defluviitaleaceae bacterium]|nr:stalk domain-containing protein [Defluviitaleaceae bacterium]